MTTCLKQPFYLDISHMNARGAGGSAGTQCVCSCLVYVNGGSVLDPFLWVSRSFAEDIGLKLFVFDATTVVFVDDLEEGVDELALDGDLQLRDEVGDLVDGEVTTLVEVKVVEDLLKEGGVASGQLEHASLHLSEEVGDGLLGHLGVLLLGHLPGRLHHADEVLVGRGAHGQVSVVVAELLESDVAVTLGGSFDIASSFEVAEEVGENLVTRLASLEELGVH